MVTWFLGDTETERGSRCLWEAQQGPGERVVGTEGGATQAPGLPFPEPSLRAGLRFSPTPSTLVFPCPPSKEETKFQGPSDRIRPGSWEFVEQSYRLISVPISSMMVGPEKNKKSPKHVREGDMSSHGRSPGCLLLRGSLCTKVI